MTALSAREQPVAFDTAESAIDAATEAVLRRARIVVIIPAYNVEAHIDSVIRSIPRYVTRIIVVDDCSVDRTSDVVEAAAQSDPRVLLVRHEVNKGVGGAMVTGFARALELRAQVAVKIDGDGQMSTRYLPSLVLPLIRGDADYTKGNRFRDFTALRHMPALRRAGNLGLSFLTKAATGYWNCFDPTNGYLAIRVDALTQLPLGSLHRRYFFETSMLSQLYLIGAVVKDIPMPAIYGDERSNLSVAKATFEFPSRLLVCLCRRVILKSFIYDFTLQTLYLILGLPMLLAGALYGLVNWIHYAHIDQPAPNGTVVISAMLLILGFQLVLSAISMDLQSVPTEPISRGALSDSSHGSAAI